MASRQVHAKFTGRLYPPVPHTQICAMNSTLTHDEAAQDLAEDLDGHPTVTDAQVLTARRPHRVEFGLGSNTTHVPDGVKDILTHHGAVLEDARWGDHTGSPAILVARPSETWKPAGQRTVRAHGGSIVVTLTREALEASGLTEDDEVDLEARTGQVRITRRQ